jgi:hypothetical protein
MSLNLIGKSNRLHLKRTLPKFYFFFILSKEMDNFIIPEKFISVSEGVISPSLSRLLKTSFFFIKF